MEITELCYIFAMSKKSNTMTKTELKKQIVKEFIKSLNPKSKFFKDDIIDFTNKLKSISDVERLKKQLNNLISLNGDNKTFNKQIDKIIQQMDKSGMFDVGNMKPPNALD